MKIGIVIRALNDGSKFSEGAQAIYSSIYVAKHDGLIPSQQSLAEYYQAIDTILVQFIYTTNFYGYDWNLLEINCG